MAEWVTVVLVLRVSLTAAIGLLSLLALIAEHLPKRLIGFKPKLAPIPGFAQFLLAGAVLSAFSGVWYDVGYAQAEWDNEKSAVDRFTTNIEGLQSITRDLKGVHRSINEQAIESCDQFTINMDNLQGSSEKLSGVANTLSSVSNEIDNVLEYSRRAVLGIDSFRIHISFRYTLDGSDSTFQALWDAISNMQGTHEARGHRELRSRPTRHATENLHNYPQNRLQALLDSTAVGWSELAFVNNSDSTKYGYHPIWQSGVMTDIRLTKNFMYLEYSRKYALASYKSKRMCLSIPCLEGYSLQLPVYYSARSVAALYGIDDEVVVRIIFSSTDELLLPLTAALFSDQSTVFESLSITNISELLKLRR